MHMHTHTYTHTHTAAYTHMQVLEGSTAPLAHFAQRHWTVLLTHTHDTSLADSVRDSNAGA